MNRELDISRHESQVCELIAWQSQIQRRKRGASWKTVAGGTESLRMHYLVEELKLDAFQFIKQT